MTERHSNRDCEWFDERLEAYLDGDLDRADADRVARHLQDCAACRRELALSERIRESLKSSAQPACPEEVARSLEGIPEVGPRWKRALPFAAGIAAALVGLALLWPGAHRSPEPSAGEIAAARQELGIALGYIAKAGRIASRDVGSVVARNGVMAPIRDGMKLELNLPVPGRARPEQVES